MFSTKAWWQSKTIWAGILAILMAAYNTASTTFGLPPVPEWVYGILGALGVYGRATATSSVGTSGGK